MSTPAVFSDKQKTINENTISLLRHAFNRSACMPVYYQKKILDIYLQYLLRDWPFEKVEQFIKYTRCLSNKLAKSALVCDIPVDASPRSKIPAIEAIGRVDMLFHLNDLAMENAALSIFNRLIDAMNPQIIKSTVRKKTFSSTAKYEASVYKAYEEKYKRLKLYSDKGRLAGDFRARFKEHLKEQLLKAGEI